MNFIDLFCGIGGIRLAFEKNGFNCVFSSEIDKHAQKTYFENFNDLPFGDITKCNVNEIPNFDILAAGFPCQPFSQAGKKMGFDDTRGTLFFEIIKILDYHKPKCFLLENVRNLKTHNNGNTFSVIKDCLTKIGYHFKYEVLNAKDFGLPQNRARIFIVGFLDENKCNKFTFPVGDKKTVKLGDFLEQNVNEKYTLSDKLWAGHQARKQKHLEKGNGFGYKIFNENSTYVSTISARYYKDGSEILIEQINKNPRKLTPREAARIQGFPENFKINPSDVNAYKQFGNSVAVTLVEKIVFKIKEVLHEQN